MPGFGAYAATKAAVTSFGEMLSQEVGRFGITVSVLAPGAVRTEFSDTSDMTTQDRDMPAALVIDVDECASAGLDGLRKGQRLIMPRRAVRTLAFVGRYIPRSLWLPLCDRLMGT